MPLIISTAASAAPIDPAEALNRLSGGSMQRVAPMLKGTAAAMRLVHKVEGTDAAALYVFANPDGQTVIAPADDAFAPVLGYLDRPVTDWSQLPPAFKYWLDEYTRQIDWQRSSRPDQYWQAAASTGRERAIPPLVTAQWGQGAPFNAYAPVIGSTRAWAGCVATAMAQVLYYHKYPTHGSGSFSYTRDGSSGSFDYENTTFDWASMRDTYAPGTYTQQEGDAAAVLTYACATGVQMGYTAYGSGAQVFRAPLFMLTHLGYDRAVRWVGRKYYSTNEWAQMIYNDLAEGLPVMYGGLSAGGGHEFVCDGYNLGDYFHINWGWDGMCDGYFRLQALTPDRQGAGGSSTNDGFNIIQDAVLGIRPAREGSERYVPVVGSGNFKPIYSPEYRETGFTWDDGGVFLMSPDGFDMQLGARIEVPGGESVYGYCPEFTFPGTGNGTSPYSIAFYSVDYDSLPPAGNYRVYPCARQIGGQWRDIRTEYGFNQFVDMNIDDEGRITYTEASNWQSTELEVTALETVAEASGTRPPAYRVWYSNRSEAPFVGKLRIVVRDRQSGQEVSRMDFDASVDGLLESNSVFEYDCNLPAGDYTAEFYYPNSGLPVDGGELPITVGEYARWALDVTITDPGTMTRSQRSTVRFTMQNTSQLAYNGNVYMQLVSQTDGSVAYSTVFPLEIASGKSTSRRVYVTPEGPGGLYSLRILNKCGQLIGQPLTVEVLDPNGIGNVTDDNAPVEYYNLQGIRVANPTPGIYIRRQGSAVSKWVIK